MEVQKRKKDKLAKLNLGRQRRGKPKVMFMLRKHKLIRRWLIRNPWMRPMTVFNYAAIRIQALFRSFLCRKRLIKTMSTYASSSMGSKTTVSGRTRVVSASTKSRIGRRPVGNRQLDKYLKCIETYGKLRRLKPKWLESGFSSWCAVRIQAWIRMIPYARRYNYKNRITNQIAALVIQSAYRNITFRRVKRQLLVDMSLHKNRRSDFDCAYSIQMKWRSYCNRRVYRYFRDLITNKLNGAPAELLKTIVPNETALLDRAAGTHIRFRLGGAIFPPKVLFKLYTHRPICDVNAFAPRNYIGEREVSASEKFNHAKSRGGAIAGNTIIRVGARYFDTVVSTATDLDTWYKREEGNNWRPISSQLLADLFTPQWLRESEVQTKPPQPFHFSKMVRKQDLIKMKKRRKREWMVKAYLLGHQGRVSEVAEQEQRGGADGGTGGGPEEDLDINDSSVLSSYMDSGALAPAPSQLKSGKGGAVQAGQQQYQQQHVYSKAMGLAPEFSHDIDVDNDMPINNEDLLKWSAALDFEDYSKTWSTLATVFPRT